MTSNSSHLFQLDLIREREISGREADIVNLWSLAIASESAAEAAGLIDRHCPPSEDTDQITEFVWMLWDIMLDIVSSPDVTSDIQESVVSVLFELVKIDRGKVLLDLVRACFLLTQRMDLSLKFACTRVSNTCGRTCPTLI